MRRSGFPEEFAFCRDSLPAAGLGHSAHQLRMPSRLISAESGRMTRHSYFGPPIAGPFAGPEKVGR